MEAEETTKGGIILTSAAKEKPSVAEVVSVGPGGTVDGKEVVMSHIRQDCKRVLRKIWCFYKMFTKWAAEEAAGVRLYPPLHEKIIGCRTAPRWQPCSR